MKLQSMNCPNCNGQLKKEGENFICSSCGSAFAIDYDDSDVAYKALQKQDEIMEKTKGFRIVFFAIMALTMLVMVFVFVKMFHSFQKNTDDMKNGFGNRTSFVTEIVFDNELGKDLILSDTEFLQNADAAAVSLLKSEHKTVKYTDFMWEKNLMTPPEASLDAEPEMVGSYLMTSGLSNHYVMIYKLDFAFEYNSEKNIKTMYDCVILDNLSVTDDGKVQSDYQVRTERRLGADLTFFAYEDKDQLYREVVLGKPGYEVTQLT
ncbi:MAG: hypothetical protein IKZ74_03470 [Clostridiales bacterium]|nr:hypothetical protein [Clostridiales bacterium]